MKSQALKIFKPFFLAALAVLALLLLFSLSVQRSANLHGLILGWIGIQVYLFWFCTTLERCLRDYFQADSRSAPRRSPLMMGTTFFRIIFLLLILERGASDGRVTFYWTAGTILTIFLSWLGFLLYWFYHKT